jgi:hypothetical protein
MGQTVLATYRLHTTTAGFFMYVASPDALDTHTDLFQHFSALNVTAHAHLQSPSLDRRPALASRTPVKPYERVRAVVSNYGETLLSAHQHLYAFT